MRRAARCPLCNDQMEVWRIVCRRCYNDTDGLRSKFHHRTGIEITEEQIETWKEAMQARRAQVEVDRREKKLEKREEAVSSRIDSVSEVVNEMDEALERLEWLRGQCREAQMFLAEELDEIGPKSSARECREAIAEAKGFISDAQDYCDVMFDWYLELRDCQVELERLVESE